jgi:cobaltochelatase CobN
VHLLVRETRSLDDEAAAVDLGHAPADLVFLSFSDADLGAAAMAWQAMPDAPGLRLANLAQLRHPMSVDLYVDQVISHANCVLVRLLGGYDYWPYGVQEVFASCRAAKIPLAVVPGDARDDPRLLAASTAPAEAVASFDAYLRHGGPDNLHQALLLAAELAGLHTPKPLPPAPLPSAGEHAPTADRPDAVIVFYRSHLLAGDVAPIDALAAALRARGLGVRALFVSSMKDPAAASFVAERLRAWNPTVVLSATAFAAGNEGSGSPLDAAGAPVLQVVLAGAGRDAWAASSRGLSQTDMAMQVVLPELDGRLLTTAISFKAEAERIAGLDFSRVVNMPDVDGIALAADRAGGWARLAATPAAARRLAIVLSDYPGAGGGQIGHAVGLDTFASLAAILSDLADAGYATDAPLNTDALVAALCHAAPAPFLELPDYESLFATLPFAVRAGITAAWGAPEHDPAVRHGAFTLRYLMRGHAVIAVQPDRGNPLDRKASYHDPDLPPRHAFVAFYLWLRLRRDIHALLHLGTHGTLEWLPGKATALSTCCLPTALLRGLPVIYPFIVNNPGEAAAAKRRLGAVTIGHLTPPLRAAGTHGAAGELERLIDEYAAADGLDRRRAASLRAEILLRAESAGLLAESGVAGGTPDDEALARLDAYLCDVKELQIRDGLHVFGREPTAERRDLLSQALLRASPAASASHLIAALDRSAPNERSALLSALDGRFVAPGPAGAPTRGRADVLPTGRNLFAIDPRAVPTRSAFALAQRAAEVLLSRHLQDHGEWPRSLVIDLWGSTTLRTGGEDFSLALILLGVMPLWDEGSSRVSGFEILPLARLDRPRVDVTLRISGLFRDAFEAQLLLFDSAVRAVAARDEAPDWNPIAVTRTASGAAQPLSRIFGPAPGSYGSGLGDLLARGGWTERGDLGAAYLAASGHAYPTQGVPGTSDFAARIATADAFIHTQDHAEADLLDSVDQAAHQGGFAAAANSLGASLALYHLDIADPERPRPRTVAEEVVRVVRGRAANPSWIAGMLRHDYRGAAEIARTLDSLHAFAATLPDRLDAQFDLYFEATLGDETVDARLRTANPQAHAAMTEKFRDALRRDLWRPRRNAVSAMLAA